MWANWIMQLMHLCHSLSPCISRISTIGPGCSGFTACIAKWISNAEMSTWRHPNTSATYSNLTTGETSSSTHNFPCRILPGTWLATLAPSCAKYRWISSTDWGPSKNPIYSNLASQCLKHLSNILFGLVVSEGPSGHWRGTSPSPWITLPEASSGLFEAVKFPPVKRGKDKHEKPMKTLKKRFLKLSEVEIWRFFPSFAGTLDDADVQVLLSCLRK